MNFLEALKMLQDGKCVGIRSENNVDDYYYFLDTADSILMCKKDSAQIYYHPRINPSIYFSEWELVSPAITPMPGELWEQSGGLYFILKHGSRVWLGGFVDNIDSEMIHGNNKWKRLYPPVLGEVE